MCLPWQLQISLKITRIKWIKMDGDQIDLQHFGIKVWIFGVVNHCGYCSHLPFSKKNLFDKELTIFINWKWSSALRAFFGLCYQWLFICQFIIWHFYFLPTAFLPFCIFATGIFTICNFYHRHLYLLTFLPLDILPSGIFTTGIITVWHFYRWHFYCLAYLAMAFLQSKSLKISYQFISSIYSESSLISQNPPCDNGSLRPPVWYIRWLISPCRCAHYYRGSPHTCHQQTRCKLALTGRILHNCLYGEYTCHCDLSHCQLRYCRSSCEFTTGRVAEYVLVMSLICVIRWIAADRAVS